MNKAVFVSCAVMAATMAFSSPVDSVVKIFTIHSSPNYVMPWLTQPTEESTGSGCVIKGKRILTNAHNVGDHAFVRVRKQSSPQKYPAKVQAVGRDCDLAILTVDDSTFFDDLEPLEIMNDLPALHEKVAVLGYPIGGDTMSFTEGVVSRIEMQTYSHSYENLLAMQISAAINPGNSGGPVLIDDKLSGIAFECIESAQNIAYAVPAPIIRHFLVVLSEVLLDEVNMGYEPIKAMRVLKVNGAPIRNLKDLVARIETNRETYLIIEIENYGTVAIDAAKARESKDRILKQYRIPAEKSKDLM